MSDWKKRNEDWRDEDELEEDPLSLENALFFDDSLYFSFFILFFFMAPYGLEKGPNLL